MWRQRPGHPVKLDGTRKDPQFCISACPSPGGCGAEPSRSPFPTVEKENSPHKANPACITSPMQESQMGTKAAAFRPVVSLPETPTCLSHEPQRRRRHSGGVPSLRTTKRSSGKEGLKAAASHTSVHRAELPQGRWLQTSGRMSREKAEERPERGLADRQDQDRGSRRKAAAAIPRAGSPCGGGRELGSGRTQRAELCAGGGTQRAALGSTNPGLGPPQPARLSPSGTAEPCPHCRKDESWARACCFQAGGAAAAVSDVPRRAALGGGPSPAQAVCTPLPSGQCGARSPTAGGFNPGARPRAGGSFWRARSGQERGGHQDGRGFSCLLVM